MEKVTTKKLALYSGRTHPELATEVAQNLGIELGHPKIVEFANGELRLGALATHAAVTSDHLTSM